MENATFVRNEPPQDDQGPPKVDSEVEILREKVKKQIIKEGHGHKPAKLATCFCKYLAFLFVHFVQVLNITCGVIIDSFKRCVVCTYSVAGYCIFLNFHGLNLLC